MAATRKTNPAEALPEQPSPDWAAFYQSFQKPGYIHGFEIGHRLGGGVFGVVYKARRESIGKPYAIKFLRIEDPAVRQQVLSELETVSLFAQVDHPNLVSIEDRGVVDGIPYIVMGYAGEETLKSRLEERRLSQDEALVVFVQVARGVHALHEHSLVHFDLKPGNIFLKGEVARVGDYGLSKLITESAMSLTTGRGTPYYMAPEMLRRKGDLRSDIYSLGVILFECLSGTVPFVGDSEWEVLKGHEEKPVVFPPAIEAKHRVLLSKMLAKDPDERYQSLAAALHDLQAPVHPGDSIVVAAPPRAPTPSSSSARSRRHAAGVTAAHPAAAATGGVLPWISRWWPWALVWLGIALVITVSFPSRMKDMAAGIIIVNSGGLILLARFVRWVFGPKRQVPRSAVSFWFPWLLVVIGAAVITASSFPYHMRDWAAAVVTLQVGVLVLLLRGVRALLRRSG